MNLNDQAVTLEWSGAPPALLLRSFSGQGWGDAVGHRASFTALRRAEPHQATSEVAANREKLITP
jgi:hypothetical protein